MEFQFHELKQFPPPVMNGSILQNGKKLEIIEKFIGHNVTLPC